MWLLRLQPLIEHASLVDHADDGDRAAARGLDFGGRGGRRRQDTGAALRHWEWLLLCLPALHPLPVSCLVACRLPPAWQAPRVAVCCLANPATTPPHAALTPLALCHSLQSDEAKGIDALLALAVAGEESLGDAVDSEEEGAPARKKAARRTPQRRRHVAADEDESEEEPADAGAMYDQADEDFAPRQRRTPYSTPAKGRLPRPGSAHATPRRSGSRGGPHGVLAGPSPGLGLRGLSPYMLGEWRGLVVPAGARR